MTKFKMKSPPQKVNPPNLDRKIVSCQLELERNISLKEINDTLQFEGLTQAQIDNALISLVFDYYDLVETVITYERFETDVEYQRRIKGQQKRYNDYLKKLAEYEKWQNDNEDLIKKHQEEEKRKVLEAKQKKAQQLERELEKIKKQLDSLEDSV